MFGTGTQLQVPHYEQRPGPGEYNSVSSIASTPLYPSAPKYRFGTSIQRPLPAGARGRGASSHKIPKSSDPGPGEYDLSASVPWLSDDRAIGFGTAQQRPKATAQRAPGPGTYKGYSMTGALNLQCTVQSRPSYGFGTASRLPKQRLNNVPGPGAYSSASSVGKQVDHTRSWPGYSFTHAEAREV